MRTQNVPVDIKEEVIRRYQELGYGQIKTGQPWGFSVALVKDILQEANIPIRNFSQAASISNRNRAIGINHSYFDIESPNMAYLLGILASDGTVRRDKNEIKLTLSSVDVGFLEQIKAELDYQGEIKTYVTKEGFSNSTLAFTSERIKTRLAGYNIVPNKTQTFVFPAHLQRKYWRDFFRGYFDGDGSVNTAGLALRVSLCSNTRNVLETFITFFYEAYNIAPVNIYQRADGLYYFQYSTVATRQFYKAFYYEGCLCLERKRQKFEDLVK